MLCPLAKGVASERSKFYKRSNLNITYRDAAKDKDRRRRIDALFFLFFN